MNMFERASRNKLRFSTKRGLISTEDLWDLSLQDLDHIAIAVNKQVKEQGTESFLAQKQSTTSTVLQLQLDLLKHVISSKESAAEAAKTRAVNDAKRARLQEILGQKEEQELMSKSTEELEKMLSEM